MKKRFLTLITIAASMAMLTACGEKSAVSSDINPNDYVTLGDYSDLSAEYEVETVTDEDIDAQMQTELSYYISSYNLYTYEEITDRDDVQTGDMVNIDYVGKKDGVAFDGGTASGYYLEIGSGTFIDGFEDGLIGKKVGETVDLDLTFPETYQSEELAGQAVVFTVTINSICDASNPITPEYDDALIARLNELGFSFDNLEDYRANIKEYLDQNTADTNETNKSNAIWQAVYDTCEVKDPPAELVERVKKRVYDTAQTYADQYGVELNDFIEQSMQMTTDEFDEMAQSSAVDSAKELLATYAIAKKENIVISQKQLQELKEEEAANAGKDVETYFEGIDDQDYYDYALAKKVDEYLATIVNVTEK